MSNPLFYRFMAQILSINEAQGASALIAFQVITSPTFDVDTCPRGNVSTLPALSPCNGCPLFEVCSDECGMNEANGYC